jgi:proliferating cell nuclear antigen
LKFKFESKSNWFLIGGADKISEFNLSLITIDSEGMGIPETEFTSICTMPSSEFARICKEFVNLSESIKIETSK